MAVMKADIVSKDNRMGQRSSQLIILAGRRGETVSI